MSHVVSHVTTALVALDIDMEQVGVAVFQIKLYLYKQPGGPTLLQKIIQKI